MAIFIYLSVNYLFSFSLFGRVTGRNRNSQKTMMLWFCSKHRGGPTSLVLVCSSQVFPACSIGVSRYSTAALQRSCHIPTLKCQGLLAIHRLCSSSTHGPPGCPLYWSFSSPSLLPAAFSTSKTLQPRKTMVPAFACTTSCLWMSPMLPSRLLVTLWISP